MRGASPVRRVLRTLAVALGLFGVGFAAVLWFAPGLVPPGVRAPLVSLAGALGGRAVAWGLAGAAGLYALVRTARGRSRPAVAPEFVERPPERPRGRLPAVGEGFERSVADVARDAGDSRDPGAPVRERLRASAVAVLVGRTDLSRAEARRAVAGGTWTDDRVPAAFLGGDGAPRFTLAERFRAWVRPDRAFRRHVDRTVAAISDLAADRSRPPAVRSDAVAGSSDPEGGRSRSTAERSRTGSDRSRTASDRPGEGPPGEGREGSA